MLHEHVVDPPYTSLFLLFVMYGGLLLIISTAAFWEWSGMASIGLAFNVVIAPVIAGLIAWRYRNSKQASPYHLAVYRGGIGYFLALVLALAVMGLASLEN